MTPILLIFVLAAQVASKSPQDLAALLPNPQWQEDKRMVRSDSGEYALTITPHKVGGFGPTDYLLARKGMKVWAATKPFFLHDAAVGNSGTVIGTSYTIGFHGFASDKETNRLDIRFLDAYGKDKQLTGWDRHGWTPDAADIPMSYGIYSLGQSNRVHLEIFDHDENSKARGRTWYTYDLDNGRLLKKWDDTQLKTLGETWYSCDIESVAGTPLIVMSWRGAFDSAGSMDLEFMLIDPDGKSVWTKTFSRGATFDKDRSRDDLLPCSTAKHFAAHIGKERVEFAVEKSGKSWGAHEVRRMAYDEEGIKKLLWTKVPIAPKPVPDKTVTLNGLTAPAPNAISGVRTFVLAGPNRFAYIENWPSSNGSAVWVDDKGLMVSKVDLAKLGLPSGTTLGKYAWLGNGRLFILGGSMPQNYQKTPCFVLNFKSKSIKRVTLADVDAPSVASIAAFPDGNIAVTSSYGLHLFDPNFKKIREFDTWVPKNKNYQFYAAGLAIDPKGRLIANESSGRVAVFKESGECLRVMDLKKHFGEGAYVPYIQADRTGGFFIYDSSADYYPKKPNMLHFDSNGKLLNAFRPRYANGAGFHPLDAVQIDEKSRIWTTDQESLIQLNATGAATKTLGSKPRAGVLTDIEDWKIGVDGSYYFLDRRTNGVLAFQPDGRLKYRFNPSSPVSKTTVSERILYLRRNGAVVIMGGDKPIVVSPEGKNIGVTKESFGPLYYPDLPEREDGKRWSRAFRETLVLKDQRGEREKVIQHRPDGGLLGNDDGVAAAPDGSVCIATTPVGGGMWFAPGPLQVSIFGPNGEPKFNFTAPPYWPRCDVAAFDGKRIVFSTESELFASDTQGNLLWRLPFSLLPMKSADASDISQTGSHYVMVSNAVVRHYRLP